MNAKILDVLTAKFGEDIIKILLDDGKIEISKFNESPVSFINARDKKIQSFLDEGIINKDTHEKIINNVPDNWGFDFPGWLGQLDAGKKIMIIGQEPNVQNPPVQIVYGFNQNANESSNNAAQRLFEAGKSAEDKNEKKGHLKLWHRIAELFEGHFGSKIEVLENCYITDICHFAPSRCGTVKKINSIFGSDNSQKWEEIRFQILSNYLEREIDALSPEIIICQSDITYKTILKILNPTPVSETQMMYPKNGYKIKFSTWRNKVNLIGVPHMGSNFNITDKFWKHHLYAVKELINSQLKIQ